MTNDLKQRISQIKNGAVPDGYISTKAGVLPKWDCAHINQIAEPITDKVGDGTYETLSISAGIGFVNQAKKFGKELSGKQYEKYTVLKRGDFSYNKGNSKTYPQGCIYRLKDRETAAVPNVFESFVVKKGNPDYYEQLFISGFLNKQLSTKINHGVRDDGLLNLTGKDFYSCYLPVPSLEEQQKIAEILMQCDKVIELKQKRIEEENKKKQALLKKVFFNSDCKEYSLCDLCSTITDGDWIESKDQSEEGIRLIQTGNVGVGRYLEKEKSAKYISNDTFKTLNCSEVFNGDILISRLPDPIGRACMIKELKTRAITAVDCTIVRFKEQLQAELFLQYATTQEYFKKLQSLSGGSTRTRISRKELEKLKIKLPDESKRTILINNLLKQQDEILITLEMDVELWKQKKKVLMQLLLTGIVRVKV